MNEKNQGLPFDQEITDELNLILEIMDKYKEVVELNGDDSRIIKSVKWLLGTQKESGAWGNDNVAYTAMAMLALNDLNNAFVQWQYKEQATCAISKGEVFLKKKYLLNNYENAVWDTSIAIRALIICGHDSRDLVSDRVKWLLQQDTKSMSAGPHHIAQMILTFTVAGVDRFEIIERCKTLHTKLQKAQYKYSYYVLSQCFIATHPFIEDSEVVDHLKSILVEFVSSTNLDSANFINICSALEAVYTIASNDIKNRLKITVASIFGETCFRDNGTWYNDELMTSWALLVLTSHSKEVIVKAPKSDVAYELSERTVAIKRLIKSQRSMLFVRWLRNYFIVFICGVMSSFFITYTTMSNAMVEWLKWGIPTVFMILSGYTLQFIRKSKKEMANDSRN